jgi:Lrp/AsnC family transcriptional regulator, leucine-responsive regulatory protein
VPAHLILRLNLDVSLDILENLVMDSGIHHAIDEISLKLLDELQKDARVPFAELGRRVGLSPSATAERVRRLEDLGIIRGYRVDIDPAALGLSILVHVRMACDGERYKQFLAYIKSIDAVRECDHVTGGDALMMKVLVRSIEELEELIMKFLNYGVPTTSVVLSRTLARNTFSLEQPKPKRAPAKSLR